MKHREEIFRVAFPADHDAAIVMQPCEQAFDFPSAAIAPQYAAILGQSSGAHGTVWRDHLDTVVLHQALVQAVAVVGAVADQPFREVGEESFVESASTSLVSCGEALATYTARGRPWPSLIAMILLPLPRRVGPMAEPLFSPS